MLLKLELAIFLIITCIYSSVCLNINQRLIPTNESAGGIDKQPNNGDPLLNNDLNGTYMYYGNNLTEISVYHNGSVDFDGSPSIAVFLHSDLESLSNMADAYFLYDSESSNYSDENYLPAQKNFVSGLLQAAYVCDFNLEYLFVVTWYNYTYCEAPGGQITFQLAIASNSTNTYALFLYDGSGECNPNVTTGFKRDDDGGYEFLILNSSDVSSLWEESNVGIRGVYIYEISVKPEALHETPPPLKPPPAVERDIRIEPSGLLEVCRNGEWGSVCDDYWTDRDADVACGQLGHLGYGATAIRNGVFPPNKMVEYILDDVRCNGDENSLFECRRNNKKHNCRKRERAGVNCITKDDIGICFWNDTKGQKTGGVIQLQYQGDLRFVCDRMWTVKDAQVACRQLKLPCSNAEPCFDGEITTEYWMDYVNCDGDEEALFACSHMGLGVSHGTCKKAGVICK